jgi:hypothetical protein
VLCSQQRSSTLLERSAVRRLADFVDRVQSSPYTGSPLQSYRRDRRDLVGGLPIKAVDKRTFDQRWDRAGEKHKWLPRGW